jgi:hypothetical protein
VAVTDRDEERLRLAFLALVAICVVGYGIFLVHGAQHRSTCAHYRGLLTAALADPFSTAPVLGLDSRDLFMVHGLRDQVSGSSWVRGTPPRNFPTAPEATNQLHDSWNAQTLAAISASLSARGC